MWHINSLYILFMYQIIHTFPNSLRHTWNKSATWAKHVCLWHVNGKISCMWPTCFAHVSCFTHVTYMSQASYKSETSMSHTWDIHETCMRHTCIITCLRHIWDIHVSYLKQDMFHTCNMYVPRMKHETWAKQVGHIHENGKISCVRHILKYVLGCLGWYNWYLNTVESVFNLFKFSYLSSIRPV